MIYYLKAGRLLLEYKEQFNKYLEIVDGRFGSILDTPPSDVEVVDCGDYTIAPGLFDTHIHGINGYDIMDGTVDAVKGISETILQLGVTRFLPTTLTSSKAELNQALKAVAEAVSDGLPGALSEGVYLEGPYFTKKNKGAQNSKYFRDPNYEEFKTWQRISGDIIVKIALAPERNGANKFISQVSQMGVLVSGAHTDATYNCCLDAVNAGMSNLVHLFNGMSGLHHREPGMVGVGLCDERVFTELICDGHHVHPSIAALASRVKGNKLVLITDCMRAGFMPDGRYNLGEFPVVMTDGIARTESGSLAGSTLKLIDGIKNLKNWSKRPLYEVWHRGSLSPALSLGKETVLGSISSGKVADYVVLNNNLEVQATAVEGEVKYQKKSL